MMKYKTENYRGHTIKFVQNILGAKPVVLAKWISKITGSEQKRLGENKLLAYANAKEVIDKQLKARGY
jgi:hypothetical protein